MYKHTQWYTMSNANSTQGLIADEATGANIAVSYDPKHAHLIAAAPEMLEALKIVYLHLEHRDGLKYRMDLYTRDERNAILAAIQKAEGGDALD